MEYIQKYTQITAAFAMSPEIAPRFELILGYHPEEQRFLSEEEEQYPLAFLRHVRGEDFLSTGLPPSHRQLALLWLKLFPDIDKHFSKQGAGFYESLWKKVLEDVEILSLAYAFYSPDLCSRNNLSKYRATRVAAEHIQRVIEERLGTDSRARRKIVWTLPFPADGPLGKIVEDKVGLPVVLKPKIGLSNHTTGLLCNILLHRSFSIKTLMDPHQFEDFVAMIFREEGWDVTRMSKTRDGGKDIVARRVITGVPMIAYIEAKRWSPAVGVKEVRAFVGTVAGGQVDKGIMVTTSRFTGDSFEYLKEEATLLKTIVLVDRTQLEAKMQKIADAEIGAYLL